MGDFVLENEMGELFYTDKIVRFCGDLANMNLLHLSFASLKVRKNNIRHLADSLNFMIKNNIIHCDIKLNNIVCNEEGKLKIIDFGGAFSLNDKQYFNYDNTCRILKSESNNKINYRTQYNTDFANSILDLISIHTEYYTPPKNISIKIIIDKSF